LFQVSAETGDVGVHELRAPSGRELFDASEQLFRPVGLAELKRRLQREHEGFLDSVEFEPQGLAVRQHGLGDGQRFGEPALGEQELGGGKPEVAPLLYVGRAFKLDQRGEHLPRFSQLAAVDIDGNGVP
jgi:hypothetical protein